METPGAFFPYQAQMINPFRLFLKVTTPPPSVIEHPPLTDSLIENETTVITVFDIGPGSPRNFFRYEKAKPFETSIPIITDDLKEWLNERTPGWQSKPSHLINLALEFTFKTEADAVLFALTWL